MNDSKTTLQDLKVSVEKFVAEREWTPFHDPKNLAMCIGIEAAELMEIFQWVTPEEAWEIANDEKQFTHLQEELADVLIYLMSLVNQMGIDISDAVRDKMAKNAKRFPVPEQKATK